jgi:hypothetical protein
MWNKSKQNYIKKERFESIKSSIYSILETMSTTLQIEEAIFNSCILWKRSVQTVFLRKI